MSGSRHRGHHVAHREDLNLSVRHGGQVLSLLVDPESRPLRLRPTLEAARKDDAVFVSAGLLCAKSAWLLDRVRATVWRILQRGSGARPGLQALLGELVRCLTLHPKPEDATLLDSLILASLLGGGQEVIPRLLLKSAEARLSGRLETWRLTAVAGEASWLPGLTAYAWQDGALAELESHPRLGRLTEIIDATGALSEHYLWLQRLRATLSGPLGPAGPRRWDGVSQSAPTSRMIPSFWPRWPSRRESVNVALDLPRASMAPDVAARLRQFPAAAPPEATEVPALLAWAIEGLVVPEASREGERLRLSPAARELWLSRLGILLDGCPGAPEAYDAVTERDYEGTLRPIFEVTPSASVEPAPTTYERLAATFQALQRRLDATLGQAACEAEAMLGPNGEEPRSLWEAVSEAEAILRGAALRARQELGLVDGRGTSSEEGAAALFDVWSSAPEADLDLGGDPRRLVPLGAPSPDGRWPALAILGFDERAMRLRFEVEPKCQVTDARGAAVDLDLVQVRFLDKRVRVLDARVARVGVVDSATFDPARFRGLCEEQGRVDAILSKLAR